MPKAMGHGITGSKTTKDPSKTTITDIMTAGGKVLPTIVDEQMPAIANLHSDYSRFLDENGKQLQTVGHHWKLSGPLSKAQRDKLDRSGVCIACHKDIPKGNLAISAMTHIAKMANVNIDNKMHKNIVNKTLNVTAWIQIVGAIFILLVILIAFYFIFIKKEALNPRNEGWK
jgi:hypothetical protein